MKILQPIIMWVHTYIRSMHNFCSSALQCQLSSRSNTVASFDRTRTEINTGLQLTAVWSTDLKTPGSHPPGSSVKFQTGERLVKVI